MTPPKRPPRQPLRPLLDTVRRLSHGDLSARTPAEHDSPEEVRRLAREVDLMAEALARRDRLLTEALERAQSYLDVVGVMVVMLTPRGSVALANRKTCAVLGREPRRCQGVDWFETFVPEPQRQAAREGFFRLLAGEEPIPETCRENWVLTASGQHRLVAWEHRLLRGPDGQALGILSAGQDITEQRRTESELRESRERYRSLVENLPGVVYRRAARPPRRMVFVSAEVERLTGQPAGRFLSGELDYAELIHADDRAEVARRVTEALAERRPFTCVYRVRHTDGRWRWAQERGQGTYDASGQAAWLDGVILDITELKTLQDEQERLSAQLQQAQKMESLGQLTGGIAHDFNNILASVLGFARLALRHPLIEAESEPADYLREVIGAGERARDLVARMLAFSRSRPGRPAEPLPARPLIMEAVKMLRATIPATLALEVSAAEDLPDVAMDPVDLHQVLVNLVINARDALGNRPGRIAIGLAPERADGQACGACHEGLRGEYVVLTVADDGDGIAPEVLPHIFEPFFTTKPPGQGGGLGLAMVHGLVHRAGGHCQVRSAPGRGATFRVYLPLAAQAGTAASTDEARLG